MSDCLPETPVLASRRRILSGVSALGVAALTPTAVSAARRAGRHLPTRPIPSSGEAVPVLGLGTFLTFDALPGAPRERFLEVMRVCREGGLRVVDTSPLYGTAETTVGDCVAALGGFPDLFVSNKVWSTGEYLADESHALRALALSEQRLWRRPIDLMQCHSLVNVETMLPYLRAWKREGRIRYLGLSHYESLYHPPLAEQVRRGGLDVVQVNYSIFNRAAETTVLPAAQAAGAAVFVNMPFEKARLFDLVDERDPPDFARAFGAGTWAAFFLKFVLSHPAVTCVLAATSDPAHAAENLAAVQGPLPDAEERARMVRHMQTLPGFASLGDRPWYPGKRYDGLIGQAQAALRARSG